MRAGPGVVALLRSVLLVLILVAAAGPQQGNAPGHGTGRAVGAQPATAHLVTPLVAKRWS
jgi:hypothetical protein